MRMKVLIVDDERHVREAIRMLVDWESFGIEEILEAPEGQTAIGLIASEQPDIIFTDMLMPVMNGAALLEWVQEHAPGSKTIVISGHDDFGYVRHTIKYGGMDYILKPIDEGQLNEALRKAVVARRSEELMRNRSQDQSMKLNQIKPIYWDKVFSTLVEEPGIYASFADELEMEFAIEAGTPRMRIAILSLETMQQRIKDKFASNLDLLSYSLANIANEFLRQYRTGYAYRNWSRWQELVIVAWRKTEDLPVLIRSINEGIYKTFGVRFDFGIGSATEFPAGLPQTYQEAAAALRQRNLLHRGNRIHIFAEKSGGSMTALNFARHQEDIRMALLSGRPEQISASVAVWFDEVRRLERITIEQLELWQHEFTVFRARCLSGEQRLHQESEPLSAREPGTFIAPVDDEGSLSLPLWQEDFTRQMLALAQLLSDQQSKTSVIREIAAYIDEHYAEELSLQDIAERCSLSREYISRRFKQEMGENISEYIERIRMDRAKVLLRNPQLRIAQISEMVGYQDDKYFSKVFKKAAGVSPNQYRKNSSTAT